MLTLSIIIPSYNTKQITLDCIASIRSTIGAQLPYEILVVDNASTDGSREALQELAQQGEIRYIAMADNVGYSKANNAALAQAQGTYILFLNSDTVVNGIDFADLCHFMDEHQDVGALTVAVTFANGRPDPAAHRGFPTIWRAATYYLGLEKLFGKIPGINAIVGGYHLTNRNMSHQHDIDSGSGAFFLTRKSLMDELHGFDEAFFMYGEDLDLAYRIKEKGLRFVYEPKYTVIHLKYQSGLKKANTPLQQKIKGHFYDAMKIFYRKHYAATHPQWVNALMEKLIDIRAQLV